MSLKSFITPGGYWEFPDTERYAVVELDRPIWLEPHPHVRGLKLFAFKLVRRYCRKRGIGHVSEDRLNKFYRSNGAPPIRPYHNHMFYKRILFDGDVPIWDHPRLLLQPND